MNYFSFPYCPLKTVCLSHFQELSLKYNIRTNLVVDNFQVQVSYFLNLVAVCKMNQSFEPKSFAF